MVRMGRSRMNGGSPLVRMMSHGTTVRPHLPTAHGQTFALIGHNVRKRMNQFPHFLRTLSITVFVIFKGIVHRSFQISDVVDGHFKDFRLFQLLISGSLQKSESCFSDQTVAFASHLVRQCHQIFQFVETFINPITSFLFDTRFGELEEQRIIDDKTLER